MRYRSLHAVLGRMLCHIPPTAASFRREVGSLRERVLYQPPERTDEYANQFDAIVLTHFPRWQTAAIPEWLHRVLAIRDGQDLVASDFGP